MTNQRDAAEATIHSHIIQHSRDCDGDYENTWRRDGRISTFDIPSTEDGAQGTYTLRFYDSVADDELLLYILDATTPTEEGYRSVTITECDDITCDANEKSTHRDFRAESMGY